MLSNTAECGHAHSAHVFDSVSGFFFGFCFGFWVGGEGGRGGGALGVGRGSKVVGSMLLSSIRQRKNTMSSRARSCFSFVCLVFFFLLRRPIFHRTTSFRFRIPPDGLSDVPRWFRSLGTLVF